MAVQKKTNRIEKVNSLIEHLLSTIILRYLSGAKGLTTITKVQCSKDLRWAKVWISIVGGDDTIIMNTLRNNLYEIQGELNRNVAMKMIPRISFHLDTSARYAEHISKIFRDIHDEAEQPSDSENE